MDEDLEVWLPWYAYQIYRVINTGVEPTSDRHLEEALTYFLLTGMDDYFGARAMVRRGRKTKEPWGLPLKLKGVERLVTGYPFFTHGLMEGVYDGECRERDWTDA